MYKNLLYDINYIITKIFCHVGLHLIHLHFFFSLEMLYILLLNKERDLSLTLYLLQILHFYCPRLLSADFSSARILVTLNIMIAFGAFHNYIYQ